MGLVSISKPEYFRARSVRKNAIADFWVTAFKYWVATWPPGPLTAGEVENEAMNAERSELLKAVS
jgi:hypothetical protein